MTEDSSLGQRSRFKVKEASRRRDGMRGRFGMRKGGWAESDEVPNRGSGNGLLLLAARAQCQEQTGHVSPRRTRGRLEE